MLKLAALHLDHRTNPVGPLRRRYIIGLLVVGLLSLIMLVALQAMVATSDRWASVINQAGWQRTLSQKIVRAADRGDHLGLMASLTEIQTAHESLLHGNAAADLPPTTQPEILDAFAQMQPSYEGLLSTGYAMASDLADGAIDEAKAEAYRRRLAKHETAYLPQMNGIVHLYEARAHAENARLVTLHMVAAIIMLGVLAGKALLVFEPAARRLFGQWEALRTSRERFDLAVAGSLDAIWDWNLLTDTLYFSPRWAEMFGDDRLASADDAQAWFRLVASHDLPRLLEALDQLRSGEVDQIDLEIEMRTRSSERVVALCRAASARDERGRVTRLAGSIADVTRQREAFERMRDMAERDELTGLVNRSGFRDRLELAFGRAHRGGRHDYAVLSFDFDGFKAVNDALGHSAGDQLLVSIARRLEAHLPEGSVIARLGGDEFAVLVDLDDVPCEGANASKRVMALCDMLITRCARPHRLGSQDIVSTASIGAVLGDDAYDSVEAIMRDADTALYAAKHAGKSQARLFDESMHHQAIRRLQLESWLRNADFDRDFELRLQPIVDLESGEPMGFEVLVRAVGCSLENVGPDVFIPVAEETGIIVPLGQWILQRSAAMLKSFDQTLGHARTVLHVNVSKRQVLHPSLMATLEAILAEYPQHRGRLILEITETSVMDRRDNLLPCMHQIRAAGFPLAMDDFGTGHSSLSCLHQFPLDEIKIDRSFILNIEGSREFTAVYHAIVTLAEHLGLKVVAEGVETEGQLAQLQAMGCTYGQGYFFDRPLSMVDAMTYMQRGRVIRPAA